MDQQGLGALRVQRIDGTGKRRVKLLLLNGLGEKPRVARMVGSGCVLEIGRDVDNLHRRGGRNEPTNEVDAVDAVCQAHVDEENIGQCAGGGGLRRVGLVRIPSGLKLEAVRHGRGTDHASEQGRLPRLVLHYGHRIHRAPPPPAHRIEHELRGFQHMCHSSIGHTENGGSRTFVVMTACF